MPPIAKVVVGPVSIPVQYNIPDAQLFSQKWWAEATKTNFFWTQFKRYTSRGTINKRIGLEIKTEVVEGTRGLQVKSNAAETAQGKGRPKQKKRMRPESTPLAPTPVATSGTEEETDSDSEAHFIEERLETDDLGIGEDMPGPGPSARPRQKPAYFPPFECTRCTKETAFSDISIEHDGTLLCKACKGNVPEVASGDIAVEMPTQAGGLFEPLKDTRAALLEPPKDTNASQATKPESLVVKVEDEKPELQDRPATTGAATKPKRQRQREDDGRILTINGEEWLVYADEKGDEHAIKLGMASKKIKIELD
ncbi:hypothetical protein A1O7_02313 [Cladophialophora yegresii CBS 114405]|uniref:Uncharacterized protein n=1 Tax=Cladophialophora yegresii CBS 114405 TaxID=1182544 RepID=W9W1S0_9EURO|nr:uncharacterized protein A1O7_02313 [Cladophialophora yegresii CBS 114405]EXJ61883.1 hypothetical protein A1O7_02313 [Cladophialophora yegresii CBS 114405]